MLITHIGLKFGSLYRNCSGNSLRISCTHNIRLIPFDNDTLPTRINRTAKSNVRQEITPVSTYDKAVIVTHNSCRAGITLMTVFVYIPCETRQAHDKRTSIDDNLTLLSLKRAALRFRAARPLASTPRSTCFYKYLLVMQYIIAKILRVVAT